MGKPKSLSSSKSSIQKLGSHKKCKPVMSKTSLKKINRKRKNMIEKMFNKLRNESAIEDASIIEIDDSRHKLSSFHSNSNLQSTNETLNDTLIILDGDSHIETPQNKCSTPNTSLFKSMVDPNTSIIQNIDDDDDDDDLHESIKCLTQEIHSSNFITIDLTTETTFKTADNTVIDLDNDQAEDGAGVSTSNTSISISGESDVTVLNINSYKKRKANKMKKFTDGVANLNAVEKGKLLEMITQTIFNGCDISNANLSIRKAISKCIETQEDTFIKEVILGQKPSRNSIGSNIYNPDKEIKAKSGLRMIIIDGSNVAMEHGRGRSFSVRGLKICVDYFTKRGHIVKAFVPRFRCKFGKSSDPRALDAMERAGLVVYTPSREIQGRMVTSYDDRYIVQCAAEFDGVIVSGDNYRDLLQENQRWRFVIENRLLPFTWVNDMLMFPKDPLGRNGPTLERFLRHD